jgi:hypothetical protein
MDIGSLGYLSLAAHGHADALGVTLTTAGTDVIVDPGTGSYFRSPGMREAFRGTGFHATVEVDNTSQSEPGGAFLWTRHAKVEDVQVDLHNGWVSASHDGYTHLNDPVSHRRSIFLLREETLLVVDRLQAGGRHCYRQLWPFHSEVDVEVEGEAELVARCGDRPVLGLRLASTAAGQLVTVRGQARPPAGWWSGRLESWEPAWLASWTVNCSGVVCLAALLSYGEDLSRAAGHGLGEISQLEIRLQGEVAVVTVGGEDVRVGPDGARVLVGR